MKIKNKIIWDENDKAILCGDCYCINNDVRRLVEENKQLKVQLKTSYREGLLQKQFDKDIEITELKEKIKELTEQNKKLKEDLIYERNFWNENNRTNYYFYKEVENKNKQLKQQLSKAIVPKFKIAQEVYVVDRLSKNIYKTQICSIRIFDGYEFAYYCKFNNENQEKICLEVDEEFVFTTRIEAGQKLKELRGKENE